MRSGTFVCGMTLGMMAGAATVMVAMPKKHQMKCATKKAVRAVEHMADTIVKNMGC